MTDLFDSPRINRRDPRVRNALRLRDDAQTRRHEGAYLLEGVKLIVESLDAGAPLHTIFVSPRLRGVSNGDRLLSRLRAGSAEVIPVSDDLLGQLASTRTPQGAVAIVPLPASDPALPAGRHGRPLLVAWRVQDPGNVGALARICDATGAAGLVVAGDGADAYHPRAVRAAAGALLRLQPVRVPPDADVQAILVAAGYRLVAATAREGTPAARFPWRGPWAVLVGSEGEGLPPALSRQACRRVYVPMDGPAESLSVTAAAAMLLYEAARQRRKHDRHHGS